MVERPAVNRKVAGSYPASPASLVLIMATYIQKECAVHGLVEHRLVKYKTGPRFRCPKCDNDYQKKYSKKIKQQCIEYKGGCCSRCGYNKCSTALEFHHLDPSQKEFGITSRNVKWETLKVELDKCILVCANCHREIHDVG